MRSVWPIFAAALLLPLDGAQSTDTTADWRIVSLEVSSETALVLQLNYTGPSIALIASYGADGSGFSTWARQGGATRSAVAFASGGHVQEQQVTDDIPQTAPWLGWISENALSVVYSPGKYLILLGTAGEVVSWYHYLETPDGFPLPGLPTELAQGSDAHWSSMPDSSSAHVQANAVYGSADLRVHEEIEIEVEHTLVGLFSEWEALSIGETTLDTPHGTLACPCMTGRITGPEADGPGTYTLRSTSANVRFNQPPIAAWFDVPLEDHIGLPPP